MSSIYLFSGPCGCGKSTLADAYASRLIHECGKKQVYVIHGDDFHKGFVETQERVGPSCEAFFYWSDILRFNWECMLNAAEKVLTKGLDVIIDYVVEDELPLVLELAGRFGARLYYVVLTASQEELRQRLVQRGDAGLIDRSLLLKEKLEGMPENQGHLYDNTNQTVEQVLAGMKIEQFGCFVGKTGQKK